jgi:2,3-dihydro-2,3-dihydroxybenzoate dehydrogenase
MRTAIVTGATQGIGKSIALGLLMEGYRVIALGRSVEKFTSLKDAASDARKRLVCECIDINDGALFEVHLETWIARGGPISHLVNAAGILEPGRMLDAPRESLRRVFETNLLATLDVSLAVGRHMAKMGAGSIVTIGSNSGTMARMGLGSYPSSKAGIIHAMKCLGLELAEFGVRCNIVSPGSTNTEMQRNYQATTGSRDAVLSGDLAQYRLGIPLKRMAEPEDVCDLVLFLLSDRSRHITMENIVLDGGATLGAK